MEDKIVGIELAKLAKELGFTEKVFSVYDTKDKKGIRLYTLEEYIGKSSRNSWDECYRNFNNPSINRWVSAPTQSVLQKWLREKYGWHIEIKLHSILGISKNFYYEIKKINGSEIFDCASLEFKTYEEALETGILDVLNILNQSRDKLIQEYLSKREPKVSERKPKVGDVVIIRILVYNIIFQESRSETRIAKITKIGEDYIKGFISDKEITFHKEQIIKYL